MDTNTLPATPAVPAQPETASSQPIPEPGIPPARQKRIPVLFAGIALTLILLTTGVGFFLSRQLASKTDQPPVDTIAMSPTPSPLPQHALIGSPDAPIQLTYAIHWAEKFQTDGIMENGELKYKGLKQYLQEYVDAHPEVAFTIQVILYNDYASKLELLSDADVAPDIYQIYAPWGVSYVNNGILDDPPQEIKDDVTENYISKDGVTIEGNIWGIPTEINTFVLLYNKNILSEAGIEAPPETWADLVEVAKKTTTYDESGNITRYGIAFIKGNDWQVVDPFLSLLFSNNGEYLSGDHSRALFNSPEGVKTLNAILQLFHENATDNNGNFFDFKDGKVAMVISPPWPRALIAEGMKDAFESTVGVAPLPYLKKPATLSYSWFMGVMAKSNHKPESWEFLKWFTSEVQPETNTTRYGDLLTNTIGAIPSRTVDIENHSEKLNDFFNKTFVDSLEFSVSEPNVANAGKIKTTLMRHIESAWAGQEEPQQALDDAAKEVNAILQAN